MRRDDPCIHLSFCPYMYIHGYPSIYLSIYLSVHLIIPSLYPFHPSICTSNYPSICLSTPPLSCNATATIFGCRVHVKSVSDRFRDSQKNGRSANMAFVCSLGAFLRIAKNVVTSISWVGPWCQRSRCSVSAAGRGAPPLCPATSSSAAGLLGNE